MTDAVLSLLTSFLGTCCANTQTLDIGQHTYRVSHQLGEGGFSTVYLVTDTVRGTQLAMKKIYCHTPDMFAKAQQEIAAYRRFQHRNIIRLVDVLVEEAAVRTVYMVLPLYKENLFDVAEHSRMAEMFWPEDRVMAVFKGVCEAVEYLHNYGKHQSRSERRRQQRQQTTEQEEGDSTEQFLDTATTTTTTTEASEDDPRQKPKKRGGYAPVGNADDAESAATHAPAASYAHRDIKLANVMLADGMTPILMDFGSLAPARFKAETRTDALRIQDDAAENCSLPYRAPELFDVQRGAEFDERTDIWSLGCLLYAMAFNRTPFEDPMDPGASIALAALSAKYSYPANNPYSANLTQLVDFMLEPDPQKRPYIDQVIAMAGSLYARH